jgi:hypothetical protein
LHKIGCVHERILGVSVFSGRFFGVCSPVCGGKVGPFKGWKEVHEWCVEFRKKSRAQDVDITAISGEVLGEVVPKLPQQEYLPSRDVEEIINHAVVKSLFGF